MNKKEMLKRLKAGYGPIRVSLEKWQDIKNGTGANEKSDNCALCHIQRDKDGVLNCSTCPIVLSGELDCDDDNSSYRKYVDDDDPNPMIETLLKAEKWQKEQDCKGTKKKTFKIGDTVEIIKKGGIEWTRSMDETIGKTGEITEISDKDYFVLLDEDTSWYYAPESLKKVAKPKRKERFFEMGQIFIIKGEDTKVILGRLEVDNECYYGLICLDSGNMWSGSTTVGDCYKITEKEFEKIKGDKSIDKFELIK